MVCIEISCFYTDICLHIPEANEPENVRVQRGTNPKNRTLTVTWDPPKDPRNFVTDCSPGYLVTLYSSADDSTLSENIKGFVTAIFSKYTVLIISQLN